MQSDTETYMAMMVLDVSYFTSLSLSLRHSLSSSAYRYPSTPTKSQLFFQRDFFLSHSLSLQLSHSLSIYIYMYITLPLSLYPFLHLKCFAHRLQELDLWNTSCLLSIRTVQYGTVQYSTVGVMTCYAQSQHTTQSHSIHVARLSCTYWIESSWETHDVNDTEQNAQLLSSKPLSLFVSLLYPSCTLFPSPSTTQFFMIFRHAFLCAPLYMIRVMRNACSWQSSVEQAMHRLARYPLSADDQTDCYML